MSKLVEEKNLNKKVRNAVRTFLIEDDKVVCTKYKTLNVGYYDIPGGKIEDGETPEDAAIREFKEETGLDVYNLEKVGNVIIEYPDRIYNMETFIANSYDGVPQEFEENFSFWIDIDNLLKEKNRYAITYLLQPEFKNDFKNKNVNVKFLVDENHKVINYYFI